MFVRNIRKIQRSAPLLQRLFGTGRPLADYQKQLEKFKLQQAKMQCDDGLPTYLKGGTRDQILFNITRGLLLFSLFLSLITIKDFLVRKRFSPKKPSKRHGEIR